MIITLKKNLNRFKSLLEKLDRKRDQILFYFIKKFWPRWLVPNYLTYGRLIIGILLFVLLFYYGIENKLLIVTLFIIGILTDLFDGSVARCFESESKFGAFIDPAIDRVLIIPIAIYSLISSHHWLLLTLIVLEAIGALISAYPQSKNVFIPPNIFAKTKMVLQSIVFALILITWPKAPNVFFINILWISAIFLVIALFFKVLEIRKVLNENYFKLNNLKIKNIIK
jgi:CDP-diacylglycerol--glycerol-3-phosphate 3-phosphatidyltransferase